MLNEPVWIAIIKATSNVCVKPASPFSLATLGAADDADERRFAGGCITAFYPHKKFIWKELNESEPE